MFSALAGFGNDTLSVGPIESLEPMGAAWVSGGYFQTLGVSAALGRLLGPADDRLDAPPAAVITDRDWTQRFNRDPAIIGRTVLIEGVTSVPIVGVTPPGFVGAIVGEAADITLAIGIRPQVQPDEASFLTDAARWLAILARPRPGVSRDQLRAQLSAAWPPLLERTTPTSLSPEVRRRRLSMTLEIVSGARGVGDLRNDFRLPLLAAMALVALVLLIACVNIANLLLARGTVLDSVKWRCGSPSGPGGDALYDSSSPRMLCWPWLASLWPSPSGLWRAAGWRRSSSRRSWKPG